MSEQENAGSAANEANDSGEKGEKGSVPYERFAAVVSKLKALEAREAKPPPQAPAKSWTRAELQAEVDAGRLTKDQATDFWDRQRDAKVTESAVNAVLQVSQQKERRREMAEYEKAVPDLADNDSAAFKKVQREYAYLVSELGMPARDETMLAALRGAFGPVETLRAARKAQPEPFNETGGGGGAPAGEEVAKGLKLRPEEKAHYEKAMRSGLYKGGWEDVKKERDEYAKRR